MSTDSPKFLLRDPTLSGTHVAFSYGGNIWLAKRDGSELRRLTSAGQESKPAFSPDGTHVAFCGEYGGPRGVFVISTEGGEPRRLTYHPDDLGVRGVGRNGDAVGWTPDGKRILFSSRRASFAGSAFPVVQLFTIPLEGGSAEPVPLVRAAQGSFSPDAGRIAYVPHIKWQPEWKGYRGGQTTPIWIADLSSSEVEADIPRDNSNDFNPMWVGDTIYFLSDRNGPVTLFSYDVRTRNVQVVVKNNGLDIKSAAARSDTIAYEQFGSLHLFNVRTREDRVLDIRPAADFPEVRGHFKNIANVVGTLAFEPEVRPMISPDGAHAAFAVHGEIFAVRSQQGDIRNLTATPGVVERDPGWSPDGRLIAYFCDESGEYALHIREVGGSGVARKINLGYPPSFYYSPTWSPDGRRIAYTDKGLNYWYVDLEQTTPVLVDTAALVDPPSVNWIPNGGRQMAWSPDSRWIAYTKVLENRLHAVFMHSVDGGANYPITDGMSDALYVAFDRRGDYLYFTASTEVGLAADFLSMTSFCRSVSRSVYALTLPGEIATLFAPKNGDESQTSTIPRSRGRTESDLDEITRQIVRLPVAARNYIGLFAGHPGTLFLIEAAPAVSWGYRQLQDVYRFDRDACKAEPILKDVVYFDLSFNGQKVLYARGDAAQRRHWFITSSQTPDSNPRPLNLDGAQVYVEPRAEWKHIYEQAWRAQRKFFYDPGFHGLDLEGTRKRYAPFLENVVTRDDLDYLLAEMLGSMSVGHMWVGGPTVYRKHANTGLLGADYTVEHGRYRFARIYEGDPWGDAGRGPLSGPERLVRAGDYLLAVNGRDVYPSADLFSYFEETAGREVRLKVGPKADGSGSREVSVVPTNSEYPLRYFAWIEGNRHTVDKLSGGRVAYVHLPDCQSSGYAAFNRYFFAQIGKQAAIIDGRYNNGGQMPDYYIDCLRRPLLGYWHVREGRDLPAPSLSLFGPKVMLINELSGSMGDVLPWSFRKAGIGPLIGKRTWGGSVGQYTTPNDTIDHGWITAPNLAFYSPDGAWEIENVGVSPDIEVDEDPRAARVGRDVQLERAVEVVVDLLKKNPPAVPDRPPYPSVSQSKR